MRPGGLAARAPGNPTVARAYPDNDSTDEDVRRDEIVEAQIVIVDNVVADALGGESSRGGRLHREWEMVTAPDRPDSQTPRPPG